MSRKKRGSGADVIYATHLSGGGFNNNPGVNRELLIENMYFRILAELAMNRFKWSNLPDTINPRFLEMTLFYNALAVFFEDERFGYLALKGSGQNYINFQNDPTGFNVVGNNYHHGPVSAKDCVPIWANYMRVPDLDIVSIYANRLANIDRTQEINIMNARVNKVMFYDQDTRLSVTNIVRQMEEGQAAIGVNSGAVQSLSDMIQAFDLGIDPDAIEKIDIIATRHWNKCMGLLGIEYGNQDKKERLVADEVDANNEQTDNMKFVNLNARKQAAEAINKKYNLDIQVDYNTEIAQQAKQVFNAAISNVGNDHGEIE